MALVPYGINPRPEVSDRPFLLMATDTMTNPLEISDRLRTAREEAHRNREPDTVHQQDLVLRSGIAQIDTNEGSGEYTITEQRWNPTTPAWADGVKPWYHVEAEAWDIEERATGQVGDYVLFWEHRCNNGTTKLIIRVKAGSPVTFGVKVTKTGGSAGDKTTQCSFVYTVDDLNSNELGTGVTPAKPRPATGAMVAPSADSYGIAFYDGDTLVLWDAGETLDVEGCT